jgi:hypothetical protein
VAEQITNGDDVTISEKSRYVSLDRIDEPEHSGVCEAQRQRGDERLGHASDSEGHIGRGITTCEIAHVGSITDADENAWHTTRDKLVGGLLQRLWGIAKQERGDRHEGGRRESCEPEPAHPA